MNKVINGIAIIVITFSMLSSVYVFAHIDDNLQFTNTGEVVTK